MAKYMTEIDRNPAKRRVRGYFTRIFKDFVNGEDTGYTLVKAGFVVAGIATVAALAIFAPYILVAGLVVGGIYVAVAIKDEYDQNKAEDQKLAEYAALEAEEAEKTKEYVDTLDNAELKENVLLFEKTINEKLLLKKLLKVYLDKLDVKSVTEAQNARKNKRKATGHLPSEIKIIRLIEETTGFDSTDKDFGSKVYAYLRGNEASEKSKQEEDFAAQVMTVFNLNYIKDYKLQAQNVKQKRSILSRIPGGMTHGLTLLQRVSQGSGMILGPAILFGVMVVGLSIAFTWPVVLVAVAVGLAAAGAAFYYEQKVQKKYAANTTNIDKGIKTKKNKIALLDRIKKLRTKEFNHDSSKLEDSFNHKLILAEAPKPTLISRIKSILKPDIIAQTIYGMSIGALVGAAIVGTILLIAAIALPPVGIPLLAATIPAIAVGGIYMLHKGYTFGKAAYQKDQELQKTLSEANKKRFKYYRDYKKDKLEPLVELEENKVENNHEPIGGTKKISPLQIKPKNSVRQDDECDPADKFKNCFGTKQELLGELMGRYDQYNNMLNEAIENANDMTQKAHLLAEGASQKAKTLEMIEQIIGVKRSSENPFNFYDHLANFLSKNPSEIDSNAKAQTFMRIMEGENLNGLITLNKDGIDADVAKKNKPRQLHQDKKVKIVHATFIIKDLLRGKEALDEARKDQRERYIAMEKQNMDNDLANSKVNDEFKKLAHSKEELVKKIKKEEDKKIKKALIQELKALEKQIDELLDPWTKMANDEKAFAKQTKKSIKVLEQLVGVKKSNDNPVEFYNHLVSFVKRGGTEEPEKMVSELMVAVESQIDGKRVQKSMGTKVANAFKSGKVNRIFKNHIFQLAATASIALPLAFIFFGPAALPLIAITFAVITTVFAVHKYCEYKANKRMELAKHVETNLPIVEKIHKLQEKTHRLKKPKGQEKVAKPKHEVVVKDDSEDQHKLVKWEQQKEEARSRGNSSIMVMRNSVVFKEDKKNANSANSSSCAGSDKQDNVPTNNDVAVNGK